MAKLKVFGGLVVNHRRNKREHGQCRAIVATTSQSAAAKIVGCSLNSFRDYWSETGNATELAAALARPGVLLLASSTRVGLEVGDFEPAEKFKP